MQVEEEINLINDDTIPHFSLFNLRPKRENDTVMAKHRLRADPPAWQSSHGSHAVPAAPNGRVVLGMGRRTTF